MPEYLAPGVYIEEMSFRSKSIEGVSTSTTGFVGPTRFGPTQGEPELLTSFGQFERIYGDLDPLAYPNTVMTNYMAHAVRAFFDNGGRRLYVTRAFTANSTTDDGIARLAVPVVTTENAASAGAAAGISAVNSARSAVDEAHAAALAALEAALLHVRLVPGSPAELATVDLTGDVLQQINDAITTMTDMSAATAARDQVQPGIEAAESVHDDATNLAAGSILGDLTDAEADLASAVTNGTTAADDDVVAPELKTLDTAALATAVTDVSAAQTTLNTLLTELSAALAPLRTALQALAITSASDRPSGAQTVAESARGVLTKVPPLTAQAQTLALVVEEAARVARFNERVAELYRLGLMRARFPGTAGNMIVTLTARLGANTLSTSAAGLPQLSQVLNYDLVYRTPNNQFYTAQSTAIDWELLDAAGAPIALSALNPAVDKLFVLRISATVQLPGRFAQPLAWDSLTVHAQRSDSLNSIFAPTILNRAREQETPLVVDSSESAPALAATLIGAPNVAALAAAPTTPITVVYQLAGGNDGQRPDAFAYEGIGDDTSTVKSGLKAFEDLEEISIVAAPGLPYDDGAGLYASDALQATQHLITHCEKLRYRVAVLDSPNDRSLSDIQAYRSVLDTTRAAIYYPWVRILDPVSGLEIKVPPSGFVAGIYARNDAERGVHKAPANEVLLGAIGLETLVNKGQQDVLNPLGINCLRFFEGRGNRVWGARTLSSDPEWKYLNIRRFFAYLERSIERSTQWTVFEPNGEALWANVRDSASDFLRKEWGEGHLAGTRPEEAFFVRCDRSTMTQNDLDNGRMICLIGVAPLKPAEFVIFRIGQWTADRRA
jgi:hypothetical protein